MFMTRLKAFRLFFLISCLGLASIFVGCSTDITPRNNLTPEQHKASAERNMELARNTTGNLALEYRIKAAEHFIKADNKDAAGIALREIQSGESSTQDMDIRNRVLEARLALLKDDNKRALGILQTISAMVAPLNSSLNTNVSGHNKRIALLLPLKGPHAEAAKTIRDGFLAAYYQFNPQTAEPAVKFYDTNDGSSIEMAYRQAIEDKVDFIVGPLTKGEVETIAGLSTDIPVLALNTIGEGKGNRKLYQFGLMPEDEIFTMVEHARNQGHKRALIIAPQNEWGNRMASTFNSAWTAKGGVVISTIGIKGNALELDAVVQSALQVNNKKCRSDIDMIFMAASPELGRQIKPLLNYYHAANLPVYSTAAIYSGTPVPGKDYDLNGVKFCDMPWVLNNTQEMNQTRQNLSKLWPNSFNRSPRYFALGMDAYRLAQQLSEAQFSENGTEGATGNLIMKNNRIQRRLTCVKFVQGVPVPD